MISVLITSSKYDYRSNLGNIVYVTRNINNIYDLFKNNNIKVKNPRKYSDEEDESKSDVNYFKIVNYEKDKEIDTYYVNMEKKIITDEKDKVILNFSSDEDANDKANLMNRKMELIKICKDMAFKKKIPRYENNYFYIVNGIEYSNNLQEDVDYLEVIKEELDKYE